MVQWIWSFLQKLWHWGMHDRSRLARGVSRNETPEQVSGGVAAEWTKESFTIVDSGSNAQRLEKEEGDKGTRTTELSVKSGGVLQKTEGSGDLDYTMKEHFFSSLNPNNR